VRWPARRYEQRRQAENEWSIQLMMGMRYQMREGMKDADMDAIE